MKVTETREIVVGAFMVATLVAAVFYAYGRPAAIETESGYPLRATFNKIDGLPVGADVRLSGMKVGRVVERRLDSHYRADLTLLIESGHRIPLDTSASIHSDGLFGVRYVALDPGGDETMLSPGARIDFTQDALVIDDLLDLIIAEGRATLARPDPAAAPAQQGD